MEELSETEDGKKEVGSHSEVDHDSDILEVKIPAPAPPLPPGSAEQCGEEKGIPVAPIIGDGKSEQAEAAEKMAVTKDAGVGSIQSANNEPSKTEDDAVSRNSHLVHTWREGVETITQEAHPVSRDMQPDSEPLVPKPEPRPVSSTHPAAQLQSSPGAFAVGGRPPFSSSQGGMTQQRVSQGEETPRPRPSERASRAEEPPTRPSLDGQSQQLSSDRSAAQVVETGLSVANPIDEPSSHPELLPQAQALDLEANR
ncbi:expressed unknown protein [Seminavis robusta]|uniref:Uncharacterized protein n=1 Tax=Seminavis robusta TaxID=568900 RepID=A0A9N8EMG6_9STRA|nr:expressed unknown protein [Seminavis robusta]|eukprot:Sro1543_g281120.1 n/a (255) ;mRNA; r:8283-9047